MALQPNMFVTIKDDDGELSRLHCGKRARVVGILGCFVVLDIDNVGLRASLIEYVQPTADNQYRCSMETLTAQPVADAILVHKAYKIEGDTYVYVEIDGPDYYGSFKALPAAIVFDGVTLGKSCYDSDRGIAVFRSNVKFAVAAK